MMESDAVKSLADAAREEAARPKKMLIGDRWVEASSGTTLPSHDPATGQVVAEIPAGGGADVDRAVAAARAAFEQGAWPAMPAARRAELMWRLSDAIIDRTEELAALETLENGAPLYFTRMLVKMGAEVLRFYAGYASKNYGRTSEVSGEMGEFHAYSRKEPVGVVGLITPWNGPIGTFCSKIAPALAVGCTCVCKPAEMTSLTALRVAELALEVGFPPGVINVVTGTGPEAGRHLAEHGDVDKLSFTGSTAVGRALIQAAAGNLKRLTLELGGKSPLLILDDADLDIAIPTAAMGIFANTGQICFASSRLYIHEAVYDRVVDGIAEFGRNLKIGAGFDPSAQLGPLISSAQRERVLGYVQSGVDDGGRIVSGGGAVGDAGYFMSPTVFADVPANARIVREEIFGPVVVASRFSDFDEAIRIANDTRYGLGAGIFTRDLSRAHRFAKRVKSGNVWINTYGMVDVSMPFGGFRESGWGREYSIEGLDAFVESKAVYARL